MSKASNREVLDIEHLPEEVLEEILLYVPTRELLNLTIVSKTFNEVISSSVKLLDKVEIIWKEHKESIDLNPLVQRKYRNLKIKYIKGIHPRLEQFIITNATSLTKLGLNFCTLSLEEFETLLTRFAGSVEELELFDVAIKKDGEDMNPIAMPKLRKLYFSDITFDNHEMFFPLIMNSKITQLEHDTEYFKTQAEYDAFSTFLLLLKRLTVLELNLGDTTALFRNTDFLSAAEFKLETFKFSVIIIEATIYENIFAFLGTQRGTLRRLIMFDCIINNEIMNRLLQLSLNELKFELFTVVNDSNAITVRNSTIQRLTIGFIDSQDVTAEEEEFICNILRNCSCLTTVSFAEFDLTIEISRVIAQEMSSFRELELYESDFNPAVTYSTMTKLTINAPASGTRVRKDVIQMIRFNPQLKKLSLPEFYQNNEEVQAAIGAANMSLEEVRFTPVDFA